MRAPSRIVATAFVLTAAAQLVPAAALADNAPAPPAEPRIVTYLARVDGMVQGAQVAFRVSDTQISIAQMDAAGFGPGPVFQADGALTDLSRAGMRVTIPAPFSANVHCEISVAGNPIARIDRFVAPPADDGGPGGGAVTCGAPVADATDAS